MPSIHSSLPQRSTCCPSLWCLTIDLPISSCDEFSLTGDMHLQADDELEQPYLAGFEWDKEESWTRLVVHLSKEAATGPGGKKKKNKGGDE
jgi:hypothetical protein